MPQNDISNSKGMVELFLTPTTGNHIRIETYEGCLQVLAYDQYIKLQVHRNPTAKPFKVRIYVESIEEEINDVKTQSRR